jgi:membrane-associated phospholipid phosphatase
VTGDARLMVTAASCLVAMAGLGAYVAHRPLTPLDVEANALRGRGTRLAVLFTRSGYWPVLAAASLAVFAFAILTHRQPVFALLLPGVQLLAQGCIDRVKAVYRRIRPDDWLYHQELGFSFPSGHATTAVVFYGGLLVYVWSIPLPDGWRIPASVVLSVLIAGIPWSRMVLAAHYGTDVTGGLLFGIACLCLMLLLLRHLPATPIFG